MKKKILVVLATATLFALTGCGKNGYDTFAKYADKYVKLGDYKGAEYTESAIEVTDDEVQYEIDYLLYNLTESQEVTDRAVENGDIVNIDFVGKMDGVEFDGGSAEGQNLTIGSKSFIDDFEEQLIGSNIGDEKVIEVTFPDPYENNPDMAGKDAEFTVKINSISISVEPELSDELIAANTDYDTVADYKEYLKGAIIESKESDADSSKRSEIIANIMDNCEFSGYPEEEMDGLIDGALESAKSSAESYGIDFETYLAYTGYESEEAYITALNDYAIEFLKEKMVICAIAKEEGMKVTSDEMDAFVNDLVEQYSLESTEDVYEYYSEEDIAYFVVADKVMNMLLENAVGVQGTEAATEAE